MSAFERLIDGIYEAATEPDLWSSVLFDVAQVVGAPAGLLLTRRNDHWMGYRCSSVMLPGADQFVFTERGASTQMTPRLLGFGRCGFVANHELVTDEEFENDVLMTAWTGPLGLHHGAATAINIPNGDLVVVQVQRRRGDPRLEPSDLEKLDAIRPHLARAGLLAARWRLDRIRAVADGLAMIGLPAAIVGMDGRVLAANPLIQAMASHVTWLPHDRITLTDKAAGELLNKAFSTIRDPSALTTRSFPARGTDADPVVVHLVPATGRSRDLFAGGFGILVITPVSAPTLPDLALIQALFDLTPAEARVARDIGAGMSVDEMAVRLGVSSHTVRSQVKMVLAKTGAARQSEVASLIAGLPRIPVT